MNAGEAEPKRRGIVGPTHTTPHHATPRHTTQHHHHVVHREPATTSTYVQSLTYVEGHTIPRILHCAFFHVCVYTLYTSHRIPHDDVRNSIVFFPGSPAAASLPGCPSIYIYVLYSEMDEKGLSRLGEQRAGRAAGRGLCVRAVHTGERARTH